jgi:hypothetical protein
MQQWSFTMSARSRILAQIQAINPWERNDTDYWPRVKTIIGGVLASDPSGNEDPAIVVLKNSIEQIIQLEDKCNALVDALDRPL